MNKKKWIYLALICIIIIPVLFFYNAFNGNPVSKLGSNSVLKKHLEKKYPNKEFHINDGFYNFKIGGYSYEVIQIGNEKEYEFEVTGLFMPTVSYDGIYYDHLDEPLIEKWGKEASEEMVNLLKKDVPELLNIDVQVEVLKGKYDTSTQWNKNMKLEKPMYIHMTTDAAGKTKKDIFETMKKIQKRLNDNDYTYDTVTINSNVQDKEYTDKDEFGYVKFSGSFTKEEKIKLNDIEQFE
ncbi:YfjL-like protein [Siminovitchia fordii]|uniref:Uncharacterized protein n=1 Tax=Siminovitchia fordii TaxID=254759 RepID=A0ABQ4KA43_9BACI|nr:hypothetical protein [Siminovitchia fordii]GIN22466.1 hypothetical protein J1TS3_36000 [Siminovitchia fordii]